MLFPNLVKYHVYDGSRLPPFAADAYEYILAGNGLVVRTETPFFTALVPAVTFPVRGLAPLRPQFRLKVGRIPEKLLSTVLADARGIRRAGGGLNEVFYQFLHYRDRVRLHRPVQQTSSVAVLASGHDDAHTFCELHSHGNMRAFWSRTDDADEQGARLYAVIGRLDTAPEICVRVGVYGYWQPLPVTAVFTGAGGFTDLFYKETLS